MFFDQDNANKWAVRGGEFLFFIMILVSMVDPSNSILHLKNPAFALLLMYNIVVFKPDFRYLTCILMPFIALMCGFISSQILGVNINDDFFIATFKGFAMLILLLWVPYYDVIKVSKAAALIFSICGAILFVAAASDDLLKAAIWKFQSEGHDGAFLLSERQFLGVEVLGINYNSTICTALPLFASSYAFFSKARHRIFNFFCTVFITFLFITSGSRSTMLLPFCLIGISFYIVYRKSRYVKLLMYPMIGIIAIALVVLVIKLAGQKNEESNIIKYAHLYSYGRLLYYFPEYFVLGQGPGSMFFSMGVREMIPQTEWSYIEIPRMCGVFCVGIFYMLLYPLRYTKQCFRQDYTMGFIISYMFFLVVAGTNPMLVNSSGMCVMMMIYSFVSKLPHDTSIVRQTQDSKVITTKG